MYNEIIEELQNIIVKLQYLNEKNKNTDTLTKKASISKIFLDYNTQEIKVFGTVRKLTNSEFTIMKKLFDAPDMFCSHEELCMAIYEYKYDKSTTKSQQVMMHRLRLKLKGIVKIETIKDKGYRITEVKGYDRGKLL